MYVQLNNGVLAVEERINEVCRYRRLIGHIHTEEIAQKVQFNIETGQNYDLFIKVCSEKLATLLP